MVNADWIRGGVLRGRSLAAWEDPLTSSPARYNQNPGERFYMPDPDIGVYPVELGFDTHS